MEIELELWKYRFLPKISLKISKNYQIEVVRPKFLNAL